MFAYRGGVIIQPVRVFAQRTASVFEGRVRVCTSELGNNNIIRLSLYEHISYKNCSSRCVCPYVGVCGKRLCAERMVSESEQVLC